MRIKQWLKLGLIALLAHSGASMAQYVCDNPGGDEVYAVENGEYKVQTNYWNTAATGQQCVSVNSSTGAWQLTQAGTTQAGGAPSAYPSIFKGCHWGNCTTNSGLPLQVSAIQNAPSQWSVSPAGSGQWDEAYDIWFSQGPTAPASGQPNGTEIMIWINHSGSVTPAGSKTGNVNINGMNWDVWTAPTGSAGFNATWNVLSYVATSPVQQVNFDLKAFFNDATGRSMLSTNWYLIDVEAGTEPWLNGSGFTSNNFSVQFNTSGGGGGGGGNTGATINSGIWYEVVNLNSGACVDDQNYSTSNGAIVQQYACNTSGQANQRWEFTPTDSGYYKITSQQNPNLALDATSLGTANFTPIQLWQYGSGTNQQWMPVATTNGAYKFVGRASGRCIDVPGASTANGVQLQLYDCNGTGAQSYQLIQR